MLKAEENALLTQTNEVSLEFECTWWDWLMDVWTSRERACGERDGAEWPQRAMRLT